LTDIDKTKHNYNQQQHKNLNKQTTKLPTDEQTKPYEAKAWFRGLETMKQILSCRGRLQEGLKD